MKGWLPLVALLLLPGGLLLAALELLRRRQAREHAADYVSQISVLKSDAPLVLPAVRPLRGIVVPPAPKKRRRARPSTRISRFEQRLTRKA